MATAVIPTSDNVSVYVYFSLILTSECLADFDVSMAAGIVLD